MLKIYYLMKSKKHWIGTFDNPPTPDINGFNQIFNIFIIKKI